MKYIRTKDGIYERMFPDCKTQRISFDHKTIEPAYFTADYEWVAQKDVIKQADTIEELCDEFIVVHENGNHVIQKKVGNGLKDMDKDYPEYLKRNNQIFYGAIWTDKGLIYVAKMNDKGELELL